MDMRTLALQSRGWPSDFQVPRRKSSPCPRPAARRYRRPPSPTRAPFINTAEGPAGEPRIPTQRGACRARGGDPQGGCLLCVSVKEIMFAVAGAAAATPRSAGWEAVTREMKPGKLPRREPPRLPETRSHRHSRCKTDFHWLNVLLICTNNPWSCWVTRTLATPFDQLEKVVVGDWLSATTRKGGCSRLGGGKICG
jgi:hypothetical protein